MESGTPGWHPDPTGRHHQRYWDGADWTDQVADASGAVATDPVAVSLGAADPAPTTAIPTAVAAPVAPPEPKAGGGAKKALLIGLVLVLIAAAGAAGAVLGGGGDEDDDVATETTEAEETTTTTEVEETTTTTEEETTTTTEPELDDPTVVIGTNVAVALPDLTDAGFEVTQVEVIDESVPDGQVTEAVEQPDGSVVLTIARPPVVRFLEQMPSVAGQAQGPTFNVSGVTYSHGIQLSECGTSDFGIEYDLGRDFRRFRATAGLLDEMPSDMRLRLEITLDGAIVSTNDLSLGETLAIDLDISGALRLAIRITTIEGRQCGSGVTRFGFGDGQLLGVPSEVPPLTD